MYGIDNLVEEALVWYDVQKHKPLDDNSLGINHKLCVAIRIFFSNRSNLRQV